MTNGTQPIGIGGTLNLDWYMMLLIGCIEGIHYLHVSHLLKKSQKFRNFHRSVRLVCAQQLNPTSVKRLNPTIGASDFLPVQVENSILKYS